MFSVLRYVAWFWVSDPPSVLSWLRSPSVRELILTVMLVDRSMVCVLEFCDLFLKAAGQ